ncbi:site-specific integrase [Ruminococcaceae bacterium OttesenSCG-928-L11]|nr:site-specific integrase [Ruminococcaceae bacterium OttesenSCG-928-L11]
MVFVKENYPKVKLVRDITSEHTTAWMKSLTWTSGDSFDEYRSRLSKVQELCEVTFGKCHHPGSWGTIDMEKPADLGKIRTAVMTREDFFAIRDSIMKTGRSNAWIAMEISSRVGIRVKGCHWLRGKDIDLQNWTVRVTKKGAKNGRARTIPIRPQDREFFRWLKERTPEDRIFRMKNGKVLKEDSINSTIRRHMEKLGLDKKYEDTTLHAVRKMYAGERMAELRGPVPLKDTKAEMKAFDILSAELGHGENRLDLYKVYVLGE